MRIRVRGSLPPQYVEVPDEDAEKLRYGHVVIDYAGHVRFKRMCGRKGPKRLEEVLGHDNFRLCADAGA